MPGMLIGLPVVRDTPAIQSAYVRVVTRNAAAAATFVNPMLACQARRSAGDIAAVVQLLASSDILIL